MVMQSLRHSKFGSVLKFILLTLLALAVGGMIMMDIGGYFQGGVANGSDVLKVENKSVSIREFDGTVRRVISRHGMTPQQAYEMGYINQILNGEVHANLVLTESEKLGILLSREHIQKTIAENLKPTLQEGQTLQDALENLMKAQGMTEKDFVKGVTRELAVDIMTTTVKSAFAGTSEQLAKDLYAFQKQTRDVDLIVFPDSGVTDVKPATEDQLKQMYESMKDTAYAIPELRTIKIAFVDSAKAGEKISITDEEVQKFYDENPKNFIVPEEKILTQVVIQDKEKAQKIFDLTQKGKSLKDATVEINGDAKSLFENIPFNIGSLMPQITEALKDKDKGVIVGPIQTPLGFHVIQYVGIQAEATRSFDSVKEALKKEMLEIKKSENLYTISTTYDELVAGGADYSEIEKQIPLTYAEIADFSLDGTDRSSADVFAPLGNDFQQDMATIIPTAFEIPTGTISPILELPSKRFATIKVMSIKDKASKPYDEVKKEIEAQFLADQKKILNAQKVKGLLADLESGKITFDDLVKNLGTTPQSANGIGIAGTVPPPLTEESRPAIFKAKVGDYVDLVVDGGYAVAHIKNYKLPEKSAVADAEIAATIKQLDDEIRDEAMIMYIDALSKKYISAVNERIIKQTYGVSSSANGAPQ